MPDRKARNRGYGYGSYGCDGAAGTSALGGADDGGVGACDEPGGGGAAATVFSTTPEGTESVVYRFRGHRDGWHRSARLVAVGTTLFGTTDSSRCRPDSETLTRPQKERIF